MLLDRLSIVDLILIFFFVYRLSMMLYHDSELGPWQLITRFKFLLGVQVSETDGAFYGMPGTFQDALLCYFCNSPWIGLVVAALYLLALLAGWHLLAQLALLPLAASGFTLLVAKFTE